MTAVLREEILGGVRQAQGASDVAAGAASLTVTSGGLSTWTFSTGRRFPVVINRGLADEEHVYATGVAGDTLTGLVRGQDSTVDQPHIAPFTVEHGLFARHVDLLNEFLSAPAAKGDLVVAAAVDDWMVKSVGANNTVLVADSAADGGVRWSATLASLTLTAPTIADFTNAQHDHGDADDGGALASPTISGTVAGSATYMTPTLTNPVVNAGSGTIVLPGAASPAQTAEGSVVWDTDDDKLTIGTGAGRKTMVDTDSTQTLSSKTLTAPTIADFTNAQHDHLDADDGGALVPAWTSWSPAVVGSGTDPDFGSGSTQGYYMQLGKLVIGWVNAIWGGSGSGGSGSLSVSLPVAAKTTGGYACATGRALDFGGSPPNHWLTGEILTATTMSLQCETGLVTALVPFAFGTANDSIRLFFTYEAA